MSENSLSEFERHFGLWGVKGQEKLRRMTVAVGGIGGIGAISALMLAKAGIGRIIICDRDSYGVENIVEQAFATYDTAGVEKIIAAKREMQRHTRHSKITAFTADLSEAKAARRLLADADILVSGVDNAAARLALGKGCSQKKIPMVVSANVGWSIFHTVYFPGEFNYASLWKDVPGLKWKAGFPDMTDATTRALVQKEWNIWVLALSEFEPNAIRQFIERDQSYYWYAAPQAYFAASLGVLDAIKILLGEGDIFRFPNVLYYDMRHNTTLGREEILKRRTLLSKAWDCGIDALVQATRAWR